MVERTCIDLNMLTPICYWNIYRHMRYAFLCNFWRRIRICGQNLISKIFRPDFGHFTYFRWVFSAIYIHIFIIFVNFFTFFVSFQLYFHLNSKESLFESRIPNISPIFCNAAYIAWTGKWWIKTIENIDLNLVCPRSMIGHYAYRFLRCFDAF